jgi:hypothetical protein
MRHRFGWTAVLAATALMGWAVAGCSGRSSLPTGPSARLGSGNIVTGEDEPEPKPKPWRVYKPVTPCPTAVRYDRANFSNPTRIDNPWSPLTPGVQYTLSGVANRGGGLLPHDVVFTVTDVTKVIDGITCVALWDRDFNEGVLAEEELAFFAQDDHGNVWGMGEYPEEFDLATGEFQGAPSTWIVGLDGAQSGTLMLGDLRRGKGYYSQGLVESIEFHDCARVLLLREKVCVPVGCFGNVLVIDEYGPFDPAGGNQRKYYAYGKGNIKIGAINDPEGETLVMSNYRILSPAEQADARANVLRLDARGYIFNDIYAQTQPAQ